MTGRPTNVPTAVERLRALAKSEALSDWDAYAIGIVLDALDVSPVSPETATAEPPRDLHEEICRILHDANTGRITPGPDDPTRYAEMATAVLARLAPVPAAVPQRAEALGYANAEVKATADQLRAQRARLYDLVCVPLEREDVLGWARLSTEIVDRLLAGSAVPAVPPDTPTAAEMDQFRADVASLRGPTPAAVPDPPSAPDEEEAIFIGFLSLPKEIQDAAMELGSGVDSTTSQEEK